MKTIIIPLQRWIDALLSIRPYVVIDTADADAIRAVGGGHRNAVYISAECVIENRADMLGMDGRPLEQLKDGLYRLWNPHDFELCDNKRREAVARMNTAAEQRTHKRNCIIRSLVSKGVNDNAAKMVVGGMTEATIETMWATMSEEERQ